MFERRLKMNQDIIYVIESKHDFREPSAFIWGHFETSTKVVTIEMLYTHPRFLNSGIATNLKLTLEQWAIEKMLILSKVQWRPIINKCEKT